jgi:hypothetical protein
VSQEREDELEAELAELQDAVLEDWVVVASHATDALRSIQSTLSWRITRPLRVTRTFQNKVAEIGTGRAVQLATAQVARRLRRGK